MSSNRSTSEARRALSTSGNQQRASNPPVRSASLSSETEVPHIMPQPPTVSQDSRQYQKLRQQQQLFHHHPPDSNGSNSSNNLTMPALVMPTPPPVEPEPPGWSAEQALSMAARQTTLTPNLGIGRSSKSVRRLSAIRPSANHTMQLGLGGELQQHLQQQLQQPPPRHQQAHPLPIPTAPLPDKPPASFMTALSPITSPDLPYSEPPQRKQSTSSQEGEKRLPPLPARRPAQNSGCKRIVNKVH